MKKEKLSSSVMAHPGGRGLGCRREHRPNRSNKAAQMREKTTWISTGEKRWRGRLDPLVKKRSLRID